MTARPIRRIAILLLAVYAFAQASVALAACGMDRGAMAQAMAMPAGHGCDDCAGQAGDADSITAACVAHCTADLQVTAAEPVFIAGTVYAQGLTLPRPRWDAGPPVAAHWPPGTLSRRILLHSFQV
jgi:hypothetical protein